MPGQEEEVKIMKKADTQNDKVQSRTLLNRAPPRNKSVFTVLCCDKELNPGFIACILTPCRSLTLLTSAPHLNRN
jgi:hypothetical protein